ncbi:hypothetical protein V8G54_000494 [Vigna mungo]|uniref:Uncharacterized protein n=1 Tax=Vigna mungo TaxID=3915 RepID=A0AAQ3P5U9_VIGMU
MAAPMDRAGEKKLNCNHKEHGRSIRSDGVDLRNTETNAGDAEETQCRDNNLKNQAESSQTRESGQNKTMEHQCQRKKNPVFEKYMMDQLIRSFTLKAAPFANSLCSKWPKTMGELQERAVEFMRIEERHVFHKGQQDEATASSVGDKGGGPKPKNLPKGPKFNQYSPMNALRAKILEEALSTNLLPPLRRNPTPRNVDGRKHCEYPQNLGHTTEEYTTLRDEQRIIFLRMEKESEELENCSSYVDREQRLIPVITFSDEDFHVPDPDQYDPMVITTVITHYSVSKEGAWMFIGYDDLIDEACPHPS